MTVAGSWESCHRKAADFGDRCFELLFLSGLIHKGEMVGVELVLSVGSVHSTLGGCTGRFVP